MRGKGDELQYIVHSTYCIGHIYKIISTLCSSFSSADIAYDSITVIWGEEFTSTFTRNYSTTMKSSHDDDDVGKY